MLSCPILLIYFLPLPLKDSPSINDLMAGMKGVLHMEVLLNCIVFLFR